MISTASSLLLGLAMAAQPTAFIAGDVVHLRSEPDRAAPIIAKLRIGTPVTVESTRGKWLLVAAADEVSGWASRAFVSDQSPSPVALRERLAEATATQRVSILERLVALEPHRNDLYAELSLAYEAAGQGARAKVAGAVAGGDGPVFVAICNAVPNTGAMMLVASYRRGRGWTSWTSLPFEAVRKGQEDPPPSPNLVAMQLELAGLAWAAVSPAAAHPMTGSPFPSPKAGLFYNGLALQLQTVSLGSCQGDDVIASAPISGAKPSPSEARALAARLAERRESYELETLAYFRAAPDAPLLVVVRFDDRATPALDHEDGKHVEQENGFWFFAIMPSGLIEDLWAVTDTGGGC